MHRLPCIAFAAVLLLLACGSTASADPCGMVPPIQVPKHHPIARIGVQKTYVFHHQGYESIVIRPAFKGSVSQFGMLIPFPSPPAMRKVPDGVFRHIAAAVDPPEVDIYFGGAGGAGFGGFGGGGLGGGAGGAMGGFGVNLPKDKVQVLREEAVGMYEVAVLAAGSAKALNLWMKDHGFRYPKGMDGVCNEYVKMGWCFVAVKARVGLKKRINPRPGQRNVDTDLPANSFFDGHVQAMAFRFLSPKLVVPMRLSAFNKGSLRNIVYLLTANPSSIRGVPVAYVRRQVPGRVLYNHLAGLLPVRIHGAKRITRRAVQTPGGKWVKLSDYDGQRNPRPYNGMAADLFISDLIATQSRKLVLTHENKEKSLVEIAERLGLRDPAIDQLNQDAFEAERARILEQHQDLLKSMTLTVIDGDFSRDFIARNNLTFRRYLMPVSLNTQRRYDANLMSPNRDLKMLGGVRVSQLVTLADDATVAVNDAVPQTPQRIGNSNKSWPMTIASLFLVAFVAVLASRRKISKHA